jgi:transposase
MIAGVSGIPADELAVVAELQGLVIEALESRNSDLETRKVELAGRVADLEGRLARLERLASRNSGNSSMPPSSDDLPGRKAPGQRERGASGKRPGKQPGAPGAYLAWRDDPDEARPLFPAGPCGCGRDLADAADLGIPGSRQVIEMPLAAAKVVQYDSHAVECACSRVHEAPPPADAGEAGTVTWGLNARALAVFLMVMHHVPVERCAGILESLSGIRPSDGFVHSLLARAAAAVRHVNMLIRALVITAAVICADETPIRAGPGPKTRKKYLLVACTRLLTCYFLGDRSLASFGAFVFPGLPGTVAVHDRYQNYDAFDEVAHQLCCAHVLRDLEDAAESYPGAAWPRQAADALRALIHAASAARDKGLPAVPDEDTAADLRLFRHAVLAGLQEVRRVPGAKARQKPGRLLLECLKNREADILRFLTDLRIPPTSNQAERDLRPAKTQQKVSGRLRSEAATRNRYAIRGYASTAVKNSAGALTAIRDALAGNPWMPAVPETA